ncbi:MAG: hypothetical protein EOO24_50425, partial [Comamonadaceae bacterium]
VLIHALASSRDPALAAFESGWPQASVHNLMDDALAQDLAAEGGITPAIEERFLVLGRYAQGTRGGDGRTLGILFTCSAFGPAIDRVRDDLQIPVLKPNEAAFEEAVALGGRIGLLVTFETALAPLRAELLEIAARAGKVLAVSHAVAHGALEALQMGDGDAHDRLVAQAADTLRDVDVLVLCQFSLARAAPSIARVPGRTVLTTPDSAVAKLRRALAG